jgi:5-methylcytosine-specific restriction endonuclease McrA
MSKGSQQLDDARHAGPYCLAVWAERHAWELDHIIPLANGGTHELPNMQMLCQPCHPGKTARKAVERGTATTGGGIARGQHGTSLDT